MSSQAHAEADAVSRAREQMKKEEKAEKAALREKKTKEKNEKTSKQIKEFAKTSLENSKVRSDIDESYLVFIFSSTEGCPTVSLNKSYDDGGAQVVDYFDTSFQCVSAQRTELLDAFKMEILRIAKENEEKKKKEKKSNSSDMISLITTDKLPATVINMADKKDSDFDKHVREMKAKYAKDPSSISKSEQLAGEFGKAHDEFMKQKRERREKDAEDAATKSKKELRDRDREIEKKKELERRKRIRSPSPEPDVYSSVSSPWPVDQFYCPGDDGPWVLSFVDKRNISCISWLVATKEDVKSCIPLVVRRIATDIAKTKKEQQQMLQDARVYRTPLDMKKHHGGYQTNIYIDNNGDFVKCMTEWLLEVADHKWGNMTVGSILNTDIWEEVKEEHSIGYDLKVIGELEFDLLLVAPHRPCPNAIKPVEEPSSSSSQSATKKAKTSHLKLLTIADLKREYNAILDKNHSPRPNSTGKTLREEILMATVVGEVSAYLSALNPYEKAVIILATHLNIEKNGLFKLKLSRGDIPMSLASAKEIITVEEEEEEESKDSHWNTFKKNFPLSDPYWIHCDEKILPELLKHLNRGGKKYTLDKNIGGRLFDAYVNTESQVSENSDFKDEIRVIYVPYMLSMVDAKFPAGFYKCNHVIAFTSSIKGNKVHNQEFHEARLVDGEIHFDDTDERRPSPVPKKDPYWIKCSEELLPKVLKHLMHGDGHRVVRNDSCWDAYVLGSSEIRVIKQSGGISIYPFNKFPPGFYTCNHVIVLSSNTSDLKIRNEYLHEASLVDEKIRFSA